MKRALPGLLPSSTLSSIHPLLRVASIDFRLPFPLEHDSNLFSFSFTILQRTTKRVTFIRSLIREVVGFAPYERRIMELLKNSKDKRARKVAKRRVRNHI